MDWEKKITMSLNDFLSIAFRYYQMGYVHSAQDLTEVVAEVINNGKSFEIFKSSFEKAEESFINKKTNSIVLSSSIN